ncbi:MAG: Nif3-like dinuclear metal center hexameric protein [Deltaproteobacteria bacterium]|jgi:dinuclear metal center YbgI/SA1388 family protein|nr:Nif3-like dinuclear metal center hexameric protein [Deltaproteobacteria bacterium]
MQVSEIIKTIEKIAPLCLAAPWDKSGLQVAATRSEAGHLAVMLDPSLESINKGLALGADFLLAHHPLSMKPRFPDTPGQYHSILSLLFRNDVCLYSAHTSLDASPLGPACWLADKLDLKDYAILEPTGQIAASSRQTGTALGPVESEIAGFGFIGDLPAPLPYDEFCRKLAEALERDDWRACGPRPDQVTRVACCPGSGSDLISVAQNGGADVYITGDLKYHAALDAEIRVLDVGHFQIEEIMMRNFARQLAAALPQLEVSFVAGSDPLAFEAYRRA